MDGIQLIVQGSIKYHLLIKFMKTCSSRKDKAVMIPFHLGKEEVKNVPIEKMACLPRDRMSEV